MISTETAGGAEVDRLSFLMLRDAYLDLANVVKLARPGMQHTLLRDLEENIVVALEELGRARSRRGEADSVTVAVAERLYTVLREARTPIPVRLDALDERFSLKFGMM